MKLSEKIKDDLSIIDNVMKIYRKGSSLNIAYEDIKMYIKQLESDIETKNNIIDKRDEEILNLMAQVNDEANEVGKLKLVK